MTALLEHYAAGTWVTPEDEGAPLLHAATGEEIARVSTAPADAAALLDHARHVGGPALRALTFHERALQLKAVAQHLMASKDELYELSTLTGATKKDSWIDIDGGIGTVFSYSSKGRRELPNDRVILDGPPEPLGRAGTFIGQHLYTPLVGAAVQINAFNFPVWGFLEKLAPAYLAGVPSIVKPASQTAYLTERAVRMIVESGHLEEGALQLVCGSPRGLLDELGGQDVVLFTGSAATARLLRGHERIQAEHVRFNAEADSLNCAILGPDATPGTPEFDLYVTELVREMTAKAGQKCTAIRRAIVPRHLVDDIIEAARAALAEVVVGHPGDEATTMGALVSLEQREEVRRSVAALQRAGELVVGAVEGFEVHGADPERGAFLPPLLLHCGDTAAAEPHDVEAFGPVSTVLGYDHVDEAVELAARGKGSLVGTVVTHDPRVARDVVLGVAPWHGRILVLDRDDAEESTGHGSPLPMLVHGGPGRAGGGEELGGIRGVHHFMQRTAVQASPDMLTAISGRWFAGARRRHDDTHPFRKHLDELEIGDTITGPSRTVTMEDIEHFAAFTGDTFYAHMDADAAAANPFFPGRVAHGYLIVSFAAGMFVDPDPGPVLANYGVDGLRFLTPVEPGDTLTVTLTAKQLTPRATADYGEVRWDAVVTNQRDEQVATYDVLTLVAKRGADLSDL